MAIGAMQHVRRMRGGAQSHLMRAKDGHFYVVKFQNNPQHLKVLANEFLATRLAEDVGLPVPPTEIIEVPEWVIANTPELRIEIAGHSVPCQPGLQFGARYICDPMEDQAFDYLPESMFDRVKNRETFAGMLAVDKWLGNANGRQAVFWKKAGDRKYKVAFVDQGYCFNAGEWTFPDLALHGVYYRNYVYAHVTGWESFEPWLGRIEKFRPQQIREIAGEIPPEWCAHDWTALSAMVETVIERRSKVRDLIAAFRDSSRRPFPAWGAEVSETAQHAYLM
jgi:HipA-like protein